MEDENPKIVYCLSCLTTIDDNHHQSFELQSGAFRTLLQVDHVTLCYTCRRIAQHSEVLIQNVQSNQILLQNLHVITDATIQTIKSTICPPVKLTHVPLHPIQLDSNYSNSEEGFVVYNNKRDVKVKLELKYEDSNCVLDDYDDGGPCDDDDRKLDLSGIENSIKEEDEYPLKLLKQELELEGIRIRSLRKNKKKGKLKKRDKTKASEVVPDCEISDERIQHLRLSVEESLQERAEKRLDATYLNAEYKCEDCIKWFSYKSSYDKHMENHDESNGDYVCDVCKQRRSTEEKLLHHKRYHTQRYKCLECGLTRLNRLTIEDHYRSKHCNGLQFSCPHCFKGFRRKVSLKKHVRRVHWVKEKVVCAHCNKLYASKETLKNHMTRRHTGESGRREKKHACQECGKAFESPSQLRNHGIKHSHRKDFYCVECDKSFKSEYILQHHLKTAMSHNSYTDLPLPCLQCKKRFAIRRDLDRHMNRVHLNIKPFQCDQCDKAYVNNWSLTEHRRLVHEGYKRPLRFPCPMCDKIFDRNTILKSHIRTHTGERPYQCSKCPCAFSQAGVLGTHVKLVHLKLTRDGRPKPAVGVK